MNHGAERSARPRRNYWALIRAPPKEIFKSSLRSFQNEKVHREISRFYLRIIAQAESGELSFYSFPDQENQRPRDQHWEYYLGRHRENAVVSALGAGFIRKRQTRGGVD